MSKTSRMLRAFALTVLLLALAAWIQQRFDGGDAGRPPLTYEGGEAAILQAFEERRSDLWVESHGTVVRLLPDDDEGSRHQRMIVRLSSGHTVLISHNIDLAPRVPLREGESVAFRGEYEWNERGGVVHWTHHDPRGRRVGGWIETGGRRYD